MENTNPEELSFEEALKALEEIVDRLSNNATNLDEMLQLYARGVDYLKRCQAKLGEAEAKIKILSEELPGKVQEMNNGS
ncbi:MAG: exodeoxyribonuclease VII small subunit [Candidatus Cloacimonetes bacterium]|nr:exodeoxyribonuclease VII small subunit [Candidatus Cloacimonadota bacterium]MDD2505751.1 exodeoxyribonuclease VII small subunit [Candidatus Cloacimonadota bacterium]MDD4146893.1 exodeoxyribonuclease VII small subunit [Candidatus Cloacimonadota bacterium]MDD4559173.1 exodeoxyribonuclease VII small subunit [Candidatus Cloacimonadota bacterium]